MLMTVHAGDEHQTPVEIKVEGKPQIWDKGRKELRFAFSDHVHVAISLEDGEWEELLKILK